MTTADRISVIYIAGEGRSGSTILAAMLGNQPGYLPVGELRGVWQAIRLDELCGCGERFSRCPFWQQVGATAFGGWRTVDVDQMLSADARFARHRGIPRQLLARAWSDSRLEEYRVTLASLYASIPHVSGCRVIVDSTKDPSYALLLRGVSNVDLRVVHLVRDSRGVAFSWAKQSVARPEYAELEALRDTFMSTRSPWRSALEWNAKNLLLHALRRTPHALVRYEDLMTRPDDELRRIRSLVHADPCSHTSLQEFDALPFHTLGGNRVRFKRGRLRADLDVEWQSKMSSRQRRTIELMTLPLLLAYGYELGATPEAPVPQT